LIETQGAVEFAVVETDRIGDGYTREVEAPCDARVLHPKHALPLVAGSRRDYRGCKQMGLEIPSTLMPAWGFT
jgi:hypothetical protein